MSTSSTLRSPQTPAREPRPLFVADRHRGRDLLTDVLGLWLLLAVFVDGWAHFNRPALETFFTPWHALLYAGLLVMAAWVTVLTLVRHQSGETWSASLPLGYRSTAVGVAVFAVGGVGDLIWHQLFGIEIAVDALVSPTHLLLGAGGALILATGLRVALATRAATGGVTWDAPAMLSLALLVSLATFFLIYTSPFAQPAPVDAFTPTPEGTPGHEAAELPVVSALSGYLVTTLLLTAPITYVWNSTPRAPRALVSAIVIPVAWLSVALVDFPSTAVAGAAGASAAAVVLDLLRPFIHHIADPPAARLWLAAAVPIGVWVGQLVGLASAAGLGWPPSLWAGVVVLCGAVGLVLQTVGTVNGGRAASQSLS